MAMDSDQGDLDSIPATTNMYISHCWLQREHLVTVCALLYHSF